MADRVSLGDLRRRHDAALREIDDLLRELKSKGKGIARAERHLRQIRDDRTAAERDHDTEAVAELDNEAQAVYAKIAARRDDRHAISRKVTDLERTAAVTQARIDRRERAKLDSIVGLDTCAMPLGWRFVLLDCREHGWDGFVNSADRTAAHVDLFGDHQSQAELWAAAQNGTGAPANPPASLCPTCGGSHEYRDDGSYGGPPGRVLPWWGLGIDLGFGDQFGEVLARLGYSGWRPYMPREPWHWNLRGDPTKALIARDRMQPR